LISDFFFQIAGLKNLPRTGWKVKLNVENSESVAEHSYMMSVMAMVLSDIKELNTEKILKMSILHDWAESKIGDFMPNEISSEKKTELEEYAMSEILDDLPSKIKNDYYDIWNDYKDSSSKEAKFVHELDRLEMALQGKIYEKENDPEKIKPFLTTAVEQIMDDDLKKILIEILQKT
jgi:putative hydrolase of HD superfamily|tara:strand:- start:92 stop:622 length:531 start_codon:yes stop_codon:yes gene_type:complete